MGGTLVGGGGGGRGGGGGGGGVGWGGGGGGGGRGDTTPPPPPQFYFIFSTFSFLEQMAHESKVPYHHLAPHHVAMEELQFLFSFFSLFCVVISKVPAWEQKSLSLLCSSQHSNEKALVPFFCCGCRWGKELHSLPSPCLVFLEQTSCRNLSFGLATKAKGVARLRAKRKPGS
jgi:hypothetical protein